jgi:hypothetical protein
LKNLLLKQVFFSSGVYEDESLRRRFEPSEARQRCFSNGPQGGIEDASHPLSPTTFEKPAFKAGFFFVCKKPAPFRLRVLASEISFHHLQITFTVIFMILIKEGIFGRTFEVCEVPCNKGCLDILFAPDFWDFHANRASSTLLRTSKK